MIKPKLLHVYHCALLILALAILWLRRGFLLGKDITVFDFLMLAVATALLLAPLFREISLGGVTLKKELDRAKEDISGKIGELRSVIVNSVAVSPTFNLQLQELVHREVSKTQQEVLRLMAEIDLQLLPLWERENSSVPAGYNQQKLELIDSRVRDLEARLASAPSEEKIHFAWALRTLYWMWLESSRNHYASSMPYQETRKSVEEGLNRLAILGK